MGYKRIILVGKGGSGKDHTRKSLEKLGFKYCASHTSRPPRDGEIDGHDYFFISFDEAESLNNNNFFYESVIFNGWFYGTSFSEFYNSDLLIMTPKGISQLKENDRKESLIVFLDVDEKIRKERLSIRKDADAVDRRLQADSKDFENFVDYDSRITDPFFITSQSWLDELNYKRDQDA